MTYNQIHKSSKSLNGRSSGGFSLMSLTLPPLDLTLDGIREKNR